MPVINEIEITEGVTAEVSLHSVKLSKGDTTLERTFKSQRVELEKTNGTIKVKTTIDSRKAAATANTIAAHIRNMLEGMDKTFTYKLTVVYSHFPMNVAVKDNLVEINNFVGEKKKRLSKILPGVEVKIKGKDITVSGRNLPAVSQTAANMEKATKVKGRDQRIFQDGIYITEKKIIE
jgi:large subunit ribosomal protein L6